MTITDLTPGSPGYWADLEWRWSQSQRLHPTVDNPGFWTSPNYKQIEDRTTALLESIGKKPEKRKPLVYVAGPYSKPDPVENINKAVKWGTKLLDDGIVTPFLPHLSGTWHMIDPRPYEDWLAYDLEIMRRCDAVLRIPGASSGADKETAEAVELGIPVYLSYAGLYAWAEQR